MITIPSNGKRYIYTLYVNEPSKIVGKRCLLTPKEGSNSVKTSFLKPKTGVVIVNKMCLKEAGKELKQSGEQVTKNCIRSKNSQQMGQKSGKYWPKKNGKRLK